MGSSCMPQAISQNSILGQSHAVTMMKPDKKRVNFIIFSKHRQEQGRGVNGKMLALLSESECRGAGLLFYQFPLYLLLHLTQIRVARYTKNQSFLLMVPNPVKPLLPSSRVPAKAPGAKALKALSR